MEAIKLLYRSFYDKSLFPDFIIRGKELGVKALCFLSLLIAVVTTGVLYSNVSKLSFQPLQTLVEGIPALTIKDGEIQESVIVTKDIMSNSDDFFMIVDTVSETPQLDNLPDTGIYVFKKGVLASAGNRAHSFLFKDFVPEDKTVVVDQAFFRNIFDQAKSVLKTVLIPVSFFSVWFLSFWGALNLLLLAVVVSYVFSAVMKKHPPLDQRVRAALVSLLPPLVLSVIAGFSGVFIPQTLYVVIGMIYMYLHFKRFEDNIVVEIAEVTSSGS